MLSSLIPGEFWGTLGPGLISSTQPSNDRLTFVWGDASPRHTCTGPRATSDVVERLKRLAIRTISECNTSPALRLHLIVELAARIDTMGKTRVLQLVVPRPRGVVP